MNIAPSPSEKDSVDGDTPLRLFTREETETFGG